MLNLRAWMISISIVIVAVAAYVLWIERPRAGYKARSLSAAGPSSNAPANNKTRTLHIDGCNKDFLVKVGELVEPRVVPGASLEQFRALYGKETKRVNAGKLGTWIWDTDPFTLTDGYSELNSLGNFVNLDVKQGHVVETLDGIELGIDSFGTILRKMRDRQIEVHERMDGPEGNWMLTVSFYSDCGHRFRSEYSRILPGTPELARKILPKANDPRGGEVPWRSDVFMNKVVTSYSLVPSNGTDDSGVGQPSEHQ